MGVWEEIKSLTIYTLFPSIPVNNGERALEIELLLEFLGRKFWGSHPENSGPGNTGLSLTGISWPLRPKIEATKFRAR